MKNVLIDTDVILDFFFDREPFSSDAAKIFALCESKEIRGFITQVAYSNVYYLLRKASRHDKVIDKLKLLFTITDVLMMDEDVVVQALNSGFADFEDALQYSAAANNGTIDAILTRNVKDYRKSKIGVLTPETFFKSRVERY